jgi:hypothetical protein
MQSQRKGGLGEQQGMFGWLGKLVDRFASAIFRRGQLLVEHEDRVREERRDVVRTVRDSVSEAMMHADNDRNRGSDEEQYAAVAAAYRASSVVREVDDEEARQLVGAWKAQFDAIPKGWKDSGRPGTYFASSRPGYPQPAWDDLQRSSQLALERLGLLLRRIAEAPTGK